MKAKLSNLSAPTNLVMHHGLKRDALLVKRERAPDVTNWEVRQQSDIAT